MTVTHINRKGKIYYLHRGITKTGKPKYFFALRNKGELVKAIPPGYEIYENPNAQVFLRRKRIPIITDEEIAIVEEGMRQYCRVKDFIIDVKKNSIVIFTPDQNADFLADSLSFLPGTRNAKIQAIWQTALSYSPMLQFVLMDKAKREFEVRRYCFLGSIDDWIGIGKVRVLPELVKTYVQHLGEESYFELF
ncbi:MAG: hypothetical protein GY805_36335 [Chloroflexi bacterium]|nr:hypothetical protein [Chloroflexota bacterium]